MTSVIRAFRSYANAPKFLNRFMRTTIFHCTCAYLEIKSHFIYEKNETYKLIRGPIVKKNSLSEMVIAFVLVLHQLRNIRTKAQLSHENEKDLI
jgi:hypothetical protein